MTNERTPEWRTFECPGCGEVEDIDITDATPGKQFRCDICDTVMEPIDE